MGAQPVTGGDSSRSRTRVRRAGDFGVDLYGPVDLITGLGTSARGFASALREARVPTHVVSTGHLFEGVTSVTREVESDPRRFPITIEHVNADSTDRFLWHYACEVASARARVAVWYWEFAALRPDWIPNVNHYDEIWVASTFGQRSVSAVTNIPVVVVPPPVTISAVQASRPIREQLGLPSDDFIFLYVFDYSSFVDRKNPQCLVDAFVDEFGGEQGVRLLIKLSHADPAATGYRRLAAAAEAHENISLVSEVLNEADLEALFETADCYVSPHRSEGFGLTLAEAMLRGCPVIATDYGATTDFLTRETGFPLEYTLVELEEDRGPYPRGYVWADPSREHLSSLLRGVAQDGSEARRRAQAAKRLIEEEYSLAAAGDRMRRRLVGLFEGVARA